MSNSIKLSPKHGVNPTIPVCFWCGKEKNEVALLGKINEEDSEAPMHVVVDYEPCDKCKELFAQGIQVVGVTETPMVDGMFPIVDDETATLYPTGFMFLATEDWVTRFLTVNEKTELLSRVLEKRKLLLPQNLVADIIEESKTLESGEVEEDENN